MEKFSKNEIEILDLFRKDIFLKKTIREMSILLKKSYPKVYDAAKKLERRKAITLEKVGGSSLCNMLLSKESISLLSFLDEQEAISKNIPGIEKILEFKEFYDDIIIVAGSYAKGKHTSKSDIDIVVIAKEKITQKQKLLENLTLTFHPEVHPLVFSYENFKEMLLDKNETFAKQVFKNKIIFRNTERYYLLIDEAIENGFRRENLH
ncbi:MAG: nucleotidyltransferase domain-containing protein [Candidatus Woesearchaeota archaeon]|jgi:predicted nucleotidyltransferase